MFSSLIPPRRIASTVLGVRRRVAAHHADHLVGRRPARGHGADEALQGGVADAVLSPAVENDEDFLAADVGIHQDELAEAAAAVHDDGVGEHCVVGVHRRHGGERSGV